MPLSSVSAAIRKRFATAYETIKGVSVEDDPHPSQASTDFPVGGDACACGPLQLNLTLGRGVVLPVCVFEETREGHHVEIPHTVVFQPVRTRFRSEEGSTGTDSDCLGCVETTNSLGETVRGPLLRSTRPQAEPESIFYDFHIESRDSVVIDKIKRAVDRLFPPQGEIEVGRDDGSSLWIDVVRTTDWFRSSLFDATLTPGDPGVRRYRWTAQFEFEDYSDNTLEGEFKPTIIRHGVTPDHAVQLFSEVD